MVGAKVGMPVGLRIMTVNGVDDMAVSYPASRNDCVNTPAWCEEDTMMGEGRERSCENE